MVSKQAQILESLTLSTLSFVRMSLSPHLVSPAPPPSTEEVGEPAAGWRCGQGHYKAQACFPGPSAPSRWSETDGGGEPWVGGLGDTGWPISRHMGSCVLDQASAAPNSFPIPLKPLPH